MRSITLRFWYSGDQDNSEWIHYPRLLGQVDFAGEVDGHDIGRFGRTELGQGGAHGAHGLLLWQHSLLSLPKVLKK